MRMMRLSNGTVASLLLAVLLASRAVMAAGSRGSDTAQQSDGPATAPQRVIVTESVLEVLGRKAPVFRVTTGDGSTVLRGRKGERLRVELVNRASLPITMHPHGLILPSAQDGVAYITQLPVEPGESFTYDFVPVQAGSYFLHSHYGWGLQDQLAMPFILDEQRDEIRDRPSDVIMMLTDFTFRSPPEIFAELRSKAGDAMPGSGMSGEAMPGMKHGAASGGGADLNDVAYDAVLANGRPIAHAEVVRVEAGSRVRLRLINASSATNFRVDLGGLRGEICAVDGEPVHPIEVERVEIAIAQRIDLWIDLAQSFTSVPIVAQGEGSRLVSAIVLAAPGAALPELPATARDASGAIGVGYSQERSLRAMTPLPKRPVDRSFEVALTGDMAKYRWDLNGITWAKSPAMTVKQGERIELVFRNRTMMSHPMHLHGHRFQVTEIDGEAIDGAYRDTVLVMPGSTVKVQFDADNPGHWMMHCHILWHEAAGMLGIIEYEGLPKPSWYRSVDSFERPSSLPRPLPGN